jgi:hypothetical protein
MEFLVSRERATTAINVLWQTDAVRQRTGAWSHSHVLGEARCLRRVDPSIMWAGGWAEADGGKTMDAGSKVKDDGCKTQDAGGRHQPAATKNG